MFQQQLIYICMKQVTTSRTPSAFAAASFSLLPGQSASIISIYGHSPDIDTLTSTILPRIQSPCFVEQSLQRARQEAQRIVRKVTTSTASEIFDAYVHMNFLDNTLRGGLPVDIANYNALHADVLSANSVRNNGDDGRTLGTTILPPGGLSDKLSSPKTFHTYSRIHGDLERDYNNIQLDYTPFAQGPGNFRDVSQNRRTDVLQVCCTFCNALKQNVYNV
jgi:hypothetical protein